MTIKHILNNVKIDITTYIIVLLSFLAGYFEIVFLTTLTIIVHELGHFITALILNLNVKEIHIFMFGGVTILDENLSIDIKKEILVIIMGPIIQICFLLLIYFLYKEGLVAYVTFNKFYNINILLLSFNLLPILPLDGGKLINNLLDLVFPYRVSHVIAITISLVSIPLIFHFDNKIFILVITLFIILKNIEEINMHKYRVQKLIIERKLKFHKYKKTKNIKKLKDIYRNKNFSIYINSKKMTLNEKEYFKIYT